LLISKYHNKPERNRLQFLVQSCRVLLTTWLLLILPLIKNVSTWSRLSKSAYTGLHHMLFPRKKCAKTYVVFCFFLCRVATCCSPRGWCSNSPEDCLCDECAYYEWQESTSSLHYIFLLSLIILYVNIIRIKTAGCFIYEHATHYRYLALNFLNVFCFHSIFFKSVSANFQLYDYNCDINLGIEYRITYS
jgi:hypothetical protein